MLSSPATKKIVHEDVDVSHVQRGTFTIGHWHDEVHRWNWSSSKLSNLVTLSNSWCHHAGVGFISVSNMALASSDFSWHTYWPCRTS